MTELIINIVDISGGTHPDDRIKIWAPQHRPDGEKVISSSPVDVKLVNGKATISVLPGPARVQIMAGGHINSVPRRVVVPDEESVTLSAVLSDAYEWEPEIVSTVQRLYNDIVRARDAAGVARDGAEDARDVAVEAAGTVAGAETVIAGARDQAVMAVGASRDSVVADVTSAGSAASSEIDEQVTVVRGHAAQTDDDRRQTGEDRAQTGRDRTATGQDRVQTGLDRQAAEAARDQAQAAAVRTDRILIHRGPGDPVLSAFPDVQVGDIIERVPDGARWEVEA